MGLTFSKSLRAGGVRFNLSRSGIGMSAGFPGLRIGVGPRGAYIAGGLGGFRYRRSIGRPTVRGRAELPRVPASVDRPFAPPAGVKDIIGRRDFDAGPVMEMADATGDDVVAGIREQRARAAWWPWVGGGWAALVAVVVENLPGLQLSVVWLLLPGVALTLWVRARDRLRRLTVLFYALDPEAAATHEALCASVQAASRSALQVVKSQVGYADAKYHSGAHRGVEMAPTSSGLYLPPDIVANVPVPTLEAEHTTLVLLPDRILLFRGADVGSVDYASIECHDAASSIIESQPTAPAGATVIDHTWRYVNRDGGPDRRFNDNHQLPICRYSTVAIGTPSGLDVRFTSHVDGALVPLADALRRRARDSTRPASRMASELPLDDAPPPSQALPRLAWLGLGVLLVAAWATIGVSIRRSESAHVVSAAPAAAPVGPPQVVKPTFDCRRAKSAAERLICSDSDLALLDQDLGRHFAAVRAALPAASQPAFVAEARTTWRDREKRCRDKACVLEWYAARRARLDAWGISGSVAQSAP